MQLCSFMRLIETINSRDHAIDPCSSDYFDSRLQRRIKLIGSAGGYLVRINSHRFTPNPNTNFIDDEINCPELARVYDYSNWWSLDLSRYDNEDAKVLERLIIMDKRLGQFVCNYISVPDGVVTAFWTRSITRTVWRKTEWDRSRQDIARTRMFKNRNPQSKQFGYPDSNLTGRDKGLLQHLDHRKQRNETPERNRPYTIRRAWGNLHHDYTIGLPNRRALKSKRAGTTENNETGWCTGVDHGHPLLPFSLFSARGHTAVRVASTRARVTMGVRVNSRGHLRASSVFSLDNACASINVCSHKLESFVMATSNDQLPGQRFVVPLCRTPPVEIHPQPSTTRSRRMSLPERDLTRLDLAQTSLLLYSHHAPANQGVAFPLEPS